MIILQRLSYFIFAVFVSTLFVYLLHKTFTPNDIINIPVLAIIIYLIINYSAEITYEKKLEKFLNQDSELSIADVMENFDGAGSRLLNKLSAYTDEEEQRNKGDQTMNLPDKQIQQIDNNSPKVFTHHQEEEVHNLPIQKHHEEEAHHLPIQKHHEEEAHHLPIQKHHQEEEETKNYYHIIGQKHSKQIQATKKQSKRPNINKHLENKKYEMENKLNRSVNPININVSYNNPVALNSFSNPDNDINKYQLDSGLSSSNKNGGRDGGGVCFSNNDSIQDSVNSTYYPAYLDNPLNKNVGGTHIDVRHKSNYEQDRMKQILTETNSPSPVMLGDPWSEWASV
jgi:hypothetical protein